MKQTPFPFSENNLNTIVDAMVDGTYQITAVHDGDSYKVNGIWVRILGVDTPEILSPYVTKTQPKGVEVGNIVRDMLKGKSVKVTFHKKDVYGRPLVKIQFNDTDFAETLLSLGLAWYTYSPKLTATERTNYKNARNAAKKSGLVIWEKGIEKPIKPSVWRKTYKGV